MQWKNIIPLTFGTLFVIAGIALPYAGIPESSASTALVSAGVSMLFAAFATILRSWEGVLIDERTMKIDACVSACPRADCPDRVRLSPRSVLSFPLFAIPLAERAFQWFFFRKPPVPASYRRCDKSYPGWL
jgi:hypothetical protein